MTGLPNLVTIEAVMGRYGIKDRRVATRIIDEAGGFKLAGRLLVSEANLAQHEQKLQAERRSQNTPPARHPTRGIGARSGKPQAPLPPEWWNEPPGPGYRHDPTTDTKEAA